MMVARSRATSTSIRGMSTLLLAAKLSSIVYETDLQQIQSWNCSKWYLFSIESSIQNHPYHHQKVGQWNTNIVEQCLKKLTSLNKPYKYIVTCIIMQKNGAGLHCANSCYWDQSSDGT
ncbi:Dynein light chain Tctex-type [Coelomomyces lativittatus]|nr:Dynein light chain Tctex-type [Coelomomyces lativittatus]